MTRLLLLAGSVLLLSGCPENVKPTDHKPSDVVIVPGARVDVGVKEKCRVEVPPEPVWQVDITPSTADAFTKGKAVLAELEQLRDYLRNKLRPAIKKCE